MITRLEAHGYRCFPSLSLALDRYNVLAGANGASKITLLDIPVLIGDMLRRQQIVGAFLERTDKDHAPRATALTDLLHKGRGDSFAFAFAFAFEARLPLDVTEALGETSMARLGHPVPTHLRYELRFEVTPRDMQVADEYLFLFAASGSQPAPGSFPQGRSVSGTSLRHPDWESVIHREDRSLTQFTPESTAQATNLPPLRVPSGQLALGTVPPVQTLFPAALWFASLLRGGVVFFDPSWEALRRPAPPGHLVWLINSGENLPWLALNLRQSAPDRFAAWVDHVRTALPQVREIEPREREEGHFAYFSVGYSGGYRVTSSGLSDGTLRIFALSILPFFDEEVTPRLVVTEVPENGTHPRAIETLVLSLSMLYDSQVWVSTHSPIVLAHTELHDILVTRLEADGSVSVVAVTNIPASGTGNGPSTSAPCSPRGAQLTPPAGMRDIIFLLAAGGVEEVLRGFLGRDQFHRSLGCGKFAFDPAQDVIVAPTWDSGVYGTAHELLRPYVATHQRAVVMVDADWDGSPGAIAIREHVGTDLAVGWTVFTVIVFEHELDAWLMNANAHLARTFRCLENYRQTLQQADWWPDGLPKPPRPKEALEHLKRQHKARVVNADFGKLAAVMSVRHCQNPAFNQLRDHLRAWFPEQP